LEEKVTEMLGEGLENYFKKKSKSEESKIMTELK